MNVKISEFQEQLANLERDIAQLSQSDSEVNSYYRLFLEKIVAVLGVGGAVWALDDEGQMNCISHMNMAMAGLQEQGQQYGLLVEGLQRVAEKGEPLVLPALGGSNIYDGGMGEEGSVNQSRHTILFVPIVSAKRLAAILILLSPSEVSPQAVRGYLGFVTGLCEKVGVYLQRKLIDDMQGQLSRTDRLRQYVSALHSNLDPKRACYALANYGQELLGVYRCMAGTYDSRGKFRMGSVSGLETVAVKSNYIKGISAVAREVCRNGKPLLVENPEDASQEAGEDGDDLFTAARLYMLQAGSMVMGVFPIFWDHRVVGALIVEKAIEESIDAKQRKQIEAMLMEAGSALENSMAYRYLPLSPLVRALGALRNKVYRMGWPRKLIWTGLLAGLILAPILIKEQVKVIGNAELVPTDARIAYVNQDGVINKVSIPDDRRVQKDDVLAVLDIREIESDIDRVEYSIEEVLVLRESLGNDQEELEKQYEQRLNALQAELTKYKLQRKQYDIYSPVTGTLITGESEIRQLHGKPVVRGDVLLEIVPSETAWDILVRITEDKAGELLESYDKLKEGEALEANIILNIRPGVTLQSQVISVARRAYVQSTGEQKYRNVIEVRIKEPEDLRDILEPRQGLEGKVAILCGRRSLLYAKTYEFINFLRVSLF